ncbi:hypothetical protein [Nonomuraea sp. SYSU D8015]|uniref:hypothetical protein n=1 Tax=Nonomuraea sp. SYSU D8015 TaxID=2593644 RepID=UPI0016611937|nr:hypothetical protein [Nonomuraea sp. SYSU D8015]
MSESTDLPVFLAHYGPSFARTAYLLTGDPDRGRDLAVNALTAVGRRWSAVRWTRPVQAVLRELYKRFLSDGTPAPDAYALAALPPNTRAAVVARYHDGLSPQQVAAIIGLWTAAHDEEIHRARIHLRTARPDLFPTPAYASPGAPATPQAPDDSLVPKAAEAQRAHSDDQDGNAPWAAPWGSPTAPPGGTPGTAPDALPEAAPGTTGNPEPTPWAAPGAEAQAAPRSEAGGAGAFAAVDDGPRSTGSGGPGRHFGGETWAVPASAWDVVPGDDDPELRAALIHLAAAEMPHVHLSGPVLRLIRRRRRIRSTAWATISVGAAGGFVALVVAATTALAGNIERAMTEPTGLPQYTESPQQVPPPIPDELEEPVRYAYAGYCRGTPNNPANPEACGQWRLTTTSGDEWRLPHAGAGYDEDTGIVLPLAVSQNGHRLAYRDNQGSYLVLDLPTGEFKRIDLDDQQATPHFTSSPDGRYFAVHFEDGATSAMLDFDTGVTRHTTGEKVRILAVGNDGTQVVSEEEDVDDVPGHASVTTVELRGARVYAGGYRIDPDLLEYGAALSSDGRTLALVSQGAKLVTMDVRTGLVMKRRTPLEDYEVIAVERWINADEVLVRHWDEDEEYVVFTKANVRTGTLSEHADEATEWMDYDSPIGVLEE